MAPEVGAALIGVCAIAISAVVNLLTVQWVRKQENRSAGAAIAAQRAIAELANQTQLAISGKARDTELVVTALDHLGGGSQVRAAGLAALRTLKETTGPTWADYRSAVGQLLHTQLVYVLTRGRNRWEAHEVENMINMAAWLTTDGDQLGFGPSRKRRLRQAMEAYIADWTTGNHENGGKPNTQAVDKFIESIEQEWLPHDVREGSAD